MTTQNWPDPKRPGVPMFPERDGWHMLDRDVWQWSAKRKAWNDTVLHPNFVLPKNMAWRKYYGPVFSPTQINEMLAGKYSLPVIQTALRVWNALDDCDRTDADDMIFLENNGLMTRGIVEDADDFEDLEVGETVWNFNAAGHALVAAIRSNLGAAP